MLAQWTADIIGKMHLNNITAKQLAEAVGWNAKYLSQVLNCHKCPKGAEQKLSAALERIVEQKQQDDVPGLCTQ